MPETKILEISSDQQAWMLHELRRCRYGYFLALHILLLYVCGKNPTEIADCLLCACSSVYRAIEDWQSGKLGDQWWPEEPTAESEQTEPVPRQNSDLQQTLDFPLCSLSFPHD